jgi:peroxiredoxin
MFDIQAYLGFGVTPSNYRRTSTPGYIAERVCREELLDLLSILPITHDKNLFYILISTFANKAQHKFIKKTEFVDLFKTHC